MIITEIVKLNRKSYRKQYSDSGFYLLRNAVLYTEAIDPIDSDRVYTETDIEIPKEPDTPEQRLSRVERTVEKNTADIEYLSMMTGTDMGV